MFDKPLGGTELMYNELMKRLPDAYKEHFSIFNYISQADFSKTTIFWNQLSYDQQAIAWMSDRELLDKIDHFVFVSNWQSEQFRKIYNVYGYKSEVIKNACIEVVNQEKSSDKIKICYTSTPYRGLDVLLRAWEILSPTDCELHVFSSCKIYGKEFADSEDYKYEHLYELCKSLPNIVYRGSVSNEILRQELGTFHIMAYPSTFEETSCIAVIEALCNGLSVICSNLGALPETTEGWANVYTYLENKEAHAQKFCEILFQEIEAIKRQKLSNKLDVQKIIYNQSFNWDTRILEWKNYLTDILLKQNNFTTRNSWDKSIFQSCFVENEYNLTRFQESDVVVDLGCHIGSFSLLAYKKGSRRIFSFEAMKYNYEIALENLKSTNINLENLAVWRSDSDDNFIEFNANIVDWNTGMGTIVKHDNVNTQIVNVNTKKLDTILSDFQQVRFLKVDIEGSEYPVLYTSKQLYKILEISGEFHELEQNQINGYNFDRQGLKRFLEDNGFSVYIEEASWSKTCGFFNAKKI
jgi:FkbM family methyltransferase